MIQDIMDNIMADNGNNDVKHVMRLFVKFQKSWLLWDGVCERDNTWEACIEGSKKWVETVAEARLAQVTAQFQDLLLMRRAIGRPAEDSLKMLMGKSEKLEVAEKHWHAMVRFAEFVKALFNVEKMRWNMTRHNDLSTPLAELTKHLSVLKRTTECVKDAFEECYAEKAAMIKVETLADAKVAR